MEAGSRRGQLWNRPEGPTRSQPLRIRPGYLVRWPVRVEQLLGQHTSPVGPQRRSDDAQIHRTYEGCAERCVFGRQPADCVRIARPHYQTVEHAWTEQVHDHGEQKKQKKHFHVMYNAGWRDVSTTQLGVALKIGNVFSVCR